MTEKVMYGTHAAQVTVTLSDGSSHQQWRQILKAIGYEGTACD